MPLSSSAIIITTSSRKERLETYLSVGDISLTDEDVKAIDHAGKKGAKHAKMMENAKMVGKWTAIAGLTGWAAWRLLM